MQEIKKKVPEPRDNRSNSNSTQPKDEDEPSNLSQRSHIKQKVKFDAK